MGLPQRKSTDEVVSTLAEETIRRLEAKIEDLETKRALAQGKADNYLLDLQAVRKARQRGRVANRKLREKVTKLEASVMALSKALANREGYTSGPDA